MRKPVRGNDPESLSATAFEIGLTGRSEPDRRSDPGFQKSTPVNLLGETTVTCLTTALRRVPLSYTVHSFPSHTDTHEIPRDYLVNFDAGDHSEMPRSPPLPNFSESISPPPVPGQTTPRLGITPRLQGLLLGLGSRKPLEASTPLFPNKDDHTRVRSEVGGSPFRDIPHAGLECALLFRSRGPQGGRNG